MDKAGVATSITSMSPPGIWFRDDTTARRPLDFRAPADRKLAEVCHGCFEARYPVGSKLRVEAAARLEDWSALVHQSTGYGWLRETAAAHPPEATESRTASSTLPPTTFPAETSSSSSCRTARAASSGELP